MSRHVNDEITYRLLPRMGDWYKQGACRGATDLFFPTTGEANSPARAICAACPVREPCLEYALEANEKYGIWAGTTEDERRVLRRQRRKAA